MRTRKGTAAGAADHRSLHRLGVLCGLGAGVWLGAAEAPTKLVNSGLSPFAISLCMVAGVFTARLTFPTLLKGTRSVAADLMRKKHLVAWAILAGALWAVANTLTVFAVRDVGLAVAFPLWNANSLFGILWGRLLFGELKGASASTIARVLLGAVAIITAAILLGYSTIHASGAAHPRALQGVTAALGASLLWGTMYVPYRKAYISGMNPLSFVAAFTVGELGTMFVLVLALDGGAHAAVFHSPLVRPMLFWLFLGGFVWVVGDILQQFATKYLGIGRGIPLSNTNQFWGLAWAALVFGELAHTSASERLLVVAGSLLMILGALSISSAAAGQREHHSTRQALARECDRYGMDYTHVLSEYARPAVSPPGVDPGADPGAARANKRDWWDYLIVGAAVAVFLWLGTMAARPAIPLNFYWVAALTVVLAAALAACGLALRRVTNFS